MTVTATALIYWGWRLSETKRVEGLRYPDYGQLVNFDPDREGGHLLPNLRFLVQGEIYGVGVRFITNSEGFRNTREFDYQAPVNSRRILFLGDSFVDGMRTDQEDTIGYRLQRLLNRPTNGQPKFEVMISGHNNPVNAWYYLQEHGHKFNPDVVIVGITLGNDLSWHSYNAGFVPTLDNQGRRLLKVAAPLQAASPRYLDMFTSGPSIC